jgi:hypothetical protein
VLFVGDVGVRRLKLARSDLALAVGWMRSRLGARAPAVRPAGAQPAALGSLFSARNRVAGRTRRVVDRPAQAPPGEEPARRPADVRVPSAEGGSSTDVASPQRDDPPAASDDTMARLRAAKGRARGRR